MVERRIYHIECFKKLMGHRIRVTYSGGEPLLCLD
jgi:sulfatase maturation enzyme AslB (radical SAM superfamily)